MASFQPGSALAGAAPGLGLLAVRILRSGGWRGAQPAVAFPGSVRRVTLLVVFAGLPGSGKSVLARGVADAIGATYLRIDTIESAIVLALMPFRDNPVGYVVAERSPTTSLPLAGTWWPMR
jgi:hypothetical protein